jgi:hypothetical protein
MNKNQRHRRMKAKRRARVNEAMFRLFSIYYWNDELKEIYLPVISKYLNTSCGTVRSAWDAR